MKVRWTRESIRLRIAPSEMEALARGEAVREELAFPGGSRWAVAIMPSPSETRLSSQEGEVRLSLAPADRERLAAPDAEGVYFLQEAEFPLRYYIEKDFPCAHPRAAEAQEAPGETFAPPDGFAARKVPSPG